MLIKRAKEETTEVVIPNIGKPEDWILAGVVDASHRTSGNLFAVGGHVIMLINKNTLAASTLHWASKKIERIVHSSAAAETLSMQKMFSTLYFIRRIISDMCGARVENLKVTPITRTDVSVTWDPLPASQFNGDIESGGYKIEYREVTDFPSPLTSSPQVELKGITIGEVVLNELIRDKNYEITGEIKLKSVF